jgi:hypothetical protein
LLEHEVQAFLNIGKMLSIKLLYTLAEGFGKFDGTHGVLHIS